MQSTLRSFLGGVSLLFLLVFTTSCASDTPPPASTPEPVTLTTAFADYPQEAALKQFLRPYPDHLSDKMNTRLEKELVVAMAAYNAENFQLAVDTFPNFTRKPGNASYIHLYKGISQLMSGLEQESYNTFQRISAANKEPFEVSEWYMALNYVAFNNVYEARRKLEKIIENNTYNAAQAKALLKVLPVK